MKETARIVEDFIGQLRRTDIYRLYEEKRNKVLECPGLIEKINQYRKDNFALQQIEGEELFEKTDAFVKQYEEFRIDPVVDEYLKAELAVCRMMQKVYLQIADAVELDLDIDMP